MLFYGSVGQSLFVNVHWKGFFSQHRIRRVFRMLLAHQPVDVWNVS